MRTAYSYIRISSEEQPDSGLGLEAQRQRIRAYCELKGLHLAELLEDPGVSGGKALSTRPAGARLLALARKSKPVVVVAKFDPLFRSVAFAEGFIIRERTKPLVSSNSNSTPFVAFPDTVSGVTARGLRTSWL